MNLQNKHAMRLWNLGMLVFGTVLVTLFDTALYKHVWSGVAFSLAVFVYHLAVFAEAKAMKRLQSNELK